MAVVAAIKVIDTTLSGSTYAAVLTSRNRDLARPSVCLSVRLAVCHVQVPNAKTKNAQKTYFGVNVPQGKTI